jgi:hypothetical protein
MTALSLRPVKLADVPWVELDRYPDRTVFQTRPWLRFLELTQRARPVVAEVRRGSTGIGWFTGAMISRLGLRVLGSPLRGFTTSYMGFNLPPGEDRAALLAPLRDFAFRELQCIHCEVMDRHMPTFDGVPLGYVQSTLDGYEVDLTSPKELILSRMNQARRHAVRRAPRNGVTVEIARGKDFADEFYDQIIDVFAKQKLPPPYPKSRLYHLIEAMEDSGSLLMVRARGPNGQPIATAISPGFNRSAYFWMGASWRAHQKLLPNEAIQWFIMNYWKERGIERYDMGGGGLYKSKYGGAPISVPWLRVSRFRALENVRARLLELRKTYRRWRGARFAAPGHGEAPY